MTQREYLEKINAGLLHELTKNEKALPPGFNRQRFCLNCITVISDMLNDKKMVDKLANIQMDSIITTFIKGAYLGLDFFNGECYAIPYGNRMEFQTDYKGITKLCKKYSKNKIKDIFAKLVKDGDEFYEEVDSGEQRIVFKPKPFSNAPIKGVFAVVTYTDGSMMYETMSVEEVDKIRNTYSKASNSKAWVSSYGEMAKKTCLRRLCKNIDLNFDNIEAISAFRDGDDMDLNRIESQTAAPTEVIDVSAQIRQAQLPDNGQKKTVDDVLNSANVAARPSVPPEPANARPIAEGALQEAQPEEFDLFGN